MTTSRSGRRKEPRAAIGTAGMMGPPWRRAKIARQTGMQTGRPNKKGEVVGIQAPCLNKPSRANLRAAGRMAPVSGKGSIASDGVLAPFLGSYILLGASFLPLSIIIVTLQLGDRRGWVLPGGGGYRQVIMMLILHYEMREAFIHSCTEIERHDLNRPDRVYREISYKGLLTCKFEISSRTKYSTIKYTSSRTPRYRS